MVSDDIKMAVWIKLSDPRLILGMLPVTKRAVSAERAILTRTGTLFVEKIGSTLKMAVIRIIANIHELNWLSSIFGGRSLPCHLGHQLDHPTGEINQVSKDPRGRDHDE